MAKKAKKAKEAVTKNDNHLKKEKIDKNIPSSNEKLITKVWYEALSQGQSYFWNIETHGKYY